MRAHVVALLPALLETLSVIEDPALNYLQMHSESAGIAEGALEAARLTAMRSSDATVAIDACLRVMDAEQLEAALPSLIHLLSRGTGLPTRAGRPLAMALRCSPRRHLRSPRRPLRSPRRQLRSPRRPPFAGTARTLVQLAQTQPQLLRPHAARLLRTLHAASLSERSEIARGAYAAAASHVARGAPVEVLGKLVQDLTARYAEWL